MVINLVDPLWTLNHRHIVSPSQRPRMCHVSRQLIPRPLHPLLGKLLQGQLLRKPDRAVDFPHPPSAPDKGEALELHEQDLRQGREPLVSLPHLVGAARRVVAPHLDLLGGVLPDVAREVEAAPGRGDADREAHVRVALGMDPRAVAAGPAALENYIEGCLEGIVWVLLRDGGGQPEEELLDIGLLVPARVVPRHGTCGLQKDLVEVVDGLLQLVWVVPVAPHYTAQGAGEAVVLAAFDDAEFLGGPQVGTEGGGVGEGL